jgi:predicted RNA-binding protein YlqC (UPF0109 family)
VNSEEDIRDTKHRLQVTKLLNEKTVLKKQNEKCRNEMSGLSAENTKLQLDVAHLDDVITKLQNENEQRLAELEKSNQLLEECDNERQRLIRTVKNVETENGTLKKQCHKLQTECTKSAEMVKKLELEMSALKNNLAKTNERLEETTQSLEASETEVINAMGLLKECQAEKNELLEQLDSSANSMDSESKKPKPKGLVVTDSVTNDVASKVNANIEWCHMNSTLNDINDDMLQEFQKADLVVLLLGAVDIRNGMKGLEAFGKLKTLALRLCTSTKVFVTEIPPSNQPGASGHISLFNYKLGKLTDLSPHIQFIETNTRSILKKEILGENDELSAIACTMFAEALNQKITMPETLKTQHESLTPNDNYRSTELVPLKAHQIGRVIGQQGSTISSLSKKFEVTMKIGRWVERSRDKKQEEQKMDGVIITGLLRNVMATADLLEI